MLTFILRAGCFIRSLRSAVHSSIYIIYSFFSVNYDLSCFTFSDFTHDQF